MSHLDEFRAERLGRPHQESILLVDDERDVLEATREFLEAELEGVKVLAARTADEAMAILRHEPIDLVVTDYRMPRRDGISFLRDAQAEAPGLEGVLVSAYLDPALAERALHEAGVREMIRKPYRTDELLFAIRERLYERSESLRDRWDPSQTQG